MTDNPAYVQVDAALEFFWHRIGDRYYDGEEERNLRVLLEEVDRLRKREESYPKVMAGALKGAAQLLMERARDIELPHTPLTGPSEEDSDD